MTTPAIVKQSDLKRMAKPYRIRTVDMRLMQEQEKSGDVTWIYFMWNPVTDLYKIGRSTSPLRRCQELSSIAGVDLDLSFSFQEPPHAEKVLHRALKPWRHAHEWFKAVPEVEQLQEEFEDFDLSTGIDNPVLTASNIEFVVNELANNYGRGASSRNREASN